MVAYTYSNATTDVWPMWTSSAITADTSSVGVVWHRWVSSGTAGTMNNVVVQPIRRPTAEERAQRQAERDAAYLRELEGIAAAKARAEELLVAHLNEEQRDEWEREDAFRVISADGERTYRIRRGWAGNVELLNAEGEAVRRYCIHPSVRVPDEDNALAQKFLIENDEEHFVRTANATELRAA